MPAPSEKRICFVIGPIGSADSEDRIHADWLLHEIVEPVLSELPDFSVLRADKIARPGLIDSQVINYLYDAEVVIADLSFNNPNEFCEIGIRHMRQLPIIHMHRSEANLPFDVNQYRSIPFSWAKAGDLSTARANLRAQLAEVLAPGYAVDNPVSKARGREQIQQHGTPSERLLLDELGSIRERLDSLEDFGFDEKQKLQWKKSTSSGLNRSEIFLHLDSSLEIDREDLGDEVRKTIEEITMGVRTTTITAGKSLMSVTIFPSLKPATYEGLCEKLSKLPAVTEASQYPF